MRAGSGCSGRAGGPGRWAGRSVNVIGAVRVWCGTCGAGSGAGPGRRMRSGRGAGTGPPAGVNQGRPGSPTTGTGPGPAEVPTAGGGGGSGPACCPPGVGLPARKRSVPVAVGLGPDRARPLRAGRNRAGALPLPGRGQPVRDRPPRGGRNRTGTSPPEGGPDQPTRGRVGPVRDQPIRRRVGPVRISPPRCGPVRGPVCCPAGWIGRAVPERPVRRGGLLPRCPSPPVRDGSGPLSKATPTVPSRPPLGVAGLVRSGPVHRVGPEPVRDRSLLPPGGPVRLGCGWVRPGCGPWRGQAVAGTVSCSVRKVRVRFQASWAWASS